jgi:hypothetical protein
VTSSAHLRPLLVTTAVVATVLGLAATWYYAAHDLTLSHYDAKAHLVVARRIFDSLTPGWRQIGAVWLPLPHVLNALPVQVDAWYQYGTSGVAISLVSFVTAAVALVWYVHRVTGAVPAAIVSAAVFLLQPDLLYLQATPMTEPLLLGLTVLGVALLARWTSTGGTGATWPPGLVLALACLTRYEAWPVTAAALAVALLLLGSGLPAAGWGVRSLDDRLRGQVSRPPAAVPGRDAARMHRWRVATTRLIPVALWPLGAFLGFLVLSKATVGEWLVTGGFYVAENPADNRPLLALQQVGWGLGRIAGWPATWLAACGVLTTLWMGIRHRRRRDWWFALALIGTAALPFYAFVSGHPFRIRYMVPLIAAAAACVGLLVAALPRRLQWAAALVVLLMLGLDRRPLGLTSPMVAEAQWDRANQRERRTVTACLLDEWRGEPILVSMGSLAHYMQEMSRDGFVLRHFVHEGVGELWFACLEHPGRHVDWLLIEERAEGGDLFSARASADPHYLDDFERRCEGGGVALYGRRRQGVASPSRLSQDLTPQPAAGRPDPTAGG